MAETSSVWFPEVRSAGGGIAMEQMCCQLRRNKRYQPTPLLSSEWSQFLKYLHWDAQIHLHKCNVALIPALPRFFFLPQLRAAPGAVPMAGCAMLHPAASSGHGSVLQQPSVLGGLQLVAVFGDVLSGRTIWGTCCKFADTAFFASVMEIV